MSKKLTRLLAIHSAPAICGIKASNLICCTDDKIDKIIEEIYELNKTYNPKIYFRILKVSGNRFLLLVYKKSVLEGYLFKNENLEFLSKYGYKNCITLDDYLEVLINKLNTSESFPHEIGIFLGYDLSDTIEFLNGNKTPILTGYWKVYSNKDEKELLFNKYTRCRRCVCNLVEKGFNIENFLK